MADYSGFYRLIQYMATRDDVMLQKPVTVRRQSPGQDEMGRWSTQHNDFELWLSYLACGGS
jgi:hypothetical protein